MTIGIYCIEHIESGKKYIGKSKDINRRLAVHKCALTNPEFSSDKANRHLWHAVQKYGWDAFETYVVEELELDNMILADREIFWMDYYQSLDRNQGYNIVRDSSSSIEVSDETRQLLAEVWRGRKHKPETIEKMKRVWTTEERKEARRNQKHTEEHKVNLSKEMTGEGNRFYGRQHTEETKEYISEVQSPCYYDQYSLDGDLVARYSSKRELEKVGFISTSVRKVCRGSQKTHKGFIWKKIPKVTND